MSEQLRHTMEDLAFLREKGFVQTADEIERLHKIEDTARDMLATLKEADSIFTALADEGHLNTHRRIVWKQMRAAIANATGEQPTQSSQS